MSIANERYAQYCDLKDAFARLAKAAESLGKAAESLGISTDSLELAFFRQKWQLVKSAYESDTGKVANKANRMLALSDDEVLAMIHTEREAEAERQYQERAKLEARTVDEWLEIVRDLEERIELLEWALQDDDWKRGF